jgi:hypothetical protein
MPDVAGYVSFSSVADSSVPLLRTHHARTRQAQRQEPACLLRLNTEGSHVSALDMAPKACRTTQPVRSDRAAGTAGMSCERRIHRVTA